MIRLAGLYSERRGPHTYWLNKARDGAGTVLGIIQGSGDGQLNMLHYEDAASAVVALAQSTGAFFRFIMHLPANFFDHNRTAYIFLYYLLQVSQARYF